MQKGKIIFLNGVRASGKTTTARTLQERLDAPFYLINFDAFINMTPIKYFTDEKYFKDSTESRKVANKAVSMLPHTIKSFSDMGNNTIIEHILLNVDTLMEECVKILHEYPVLFVHVICPTEELRRREEERGGQVGYAEGQLSYLTPENTYDITVDTFANPTEECADKIIEILNYPEKFTAFKTLWEQLTK